MVKVPSSPDQSVVGLMGAVAQHQPVLGEFVGDGQYRRAQPRVVGRQEPGEHRQQQRRVQGVVAVALCQHSARVDAVGEDVGLDLVGDPPPRLDVALPAMQFGELCAAIEGDPAHDLARREVLRLAADLPDATIRLAPVGDGLFDLSLQNRPQVLGDLLTRPRVEIHRVQHRTPHVVLHLVEGAVPDSHRPGIVVARQVGKLVLDERTFTADAVHHLQRMGISVIGAGHFGDEGEEVIGLAVQAQGVEAPERERGVPDPRVAIVPVPFALRRFRQVTWYWQPGWLPSARS